MTRGRKSAAVRRAEAVDSGADQIQARDTRSSNFEAMVPTGADMAEQARKVIEELVVTLQLQPGSTWSEAEISDLIKIGRTPVREALKRLESAYLVEIIPRNGVRIREINAIEYLRMLEMRRELERLVAVSASRRATEEEKQELARIAKTFTEMKGVDGIEFNRYHYTVKTYLTACARNAFVARAVEPCYAMSRRFFYLHQLVAHDVPVAANFHAAVFAAVARNDEVGAAAASDALMDYVEKLARRAVLDT